MKMYEIFESEDNSGKVICGFPGVGKSTYVKDFKKENGDKILDSDSSKFDKKDFPNNYIKHIKETIKEGKTILASSHDVVRNALIKEKIPFTLVYPDKKCKDEYLKRYEKRGSPESFIKLLSDNWDNWIDQCDAIDSKIITKVKLNCKEFISDKL